MSPVLLVLAMLSAEPEAGAPLAGLFPDAPVQAATPTGWEALPDFAFRRFRFALGASLFHQQMHSNGGNGLGMGLSATLQHRTWETSAQLYLHSTAAAGDDRSRNSGPATSYLRATARWVPFPAAARVMVEGGLQLGWDRAWAWCVSSADGQDQCGTVPGRVSWGAVGGLVVALRPGSMTFALGADLVLKGPGLPDATQGGPGAAVWAGPLGLQLWLEAGFGGLSW